MNEQEKTQIDYVNSLLEEAGKRDRVISMTVPIRPYECGLFKTKTNFSIIVPSCLAGGLSARSVLKQTRKHARTTHFINGQAGKNCKELVFYGEECPKKLPE